MTSNIRVKKRNGELEILDMSKVWKSLNWAFHGLSLTPLDVFDDEETIESVIFDGIETDQIQERLSSIAATKSYIKGKEDADIVAARLILQKIRKEVNNPFSYGNVDYPHLKDVVNRGIQFGKRKYNANLVNLFDLDLLNDVIDSSRDLFISHMAITTLTGSYLIKDSRDDTLIEGPQHFFMRVAMGLALKEADEIRDEKAIEFYNTLSQMNLMSSTPTLFNSATTHPQLASCFVALLEDDSLEGIFNSTVELAQYSKFSGGTAVSLTPLRSKGSLIKSTGGRSSGVIPFAKIMEQSMYAFDQGGNRPGVVAFYLEVWHKDIFDFLNAANIKQDERTRITNQFLASWIPDLFMKRVIEKGNWSLFSPSDTPDLHDLWGEQFESRYASYEKNQNIPRRVIPAMDLWKKIMETLFNNRGRGWPCFKDSCNKRNSFRGYGVVHSSNLCVEITLLNDDRNTSVCNLASVNLLNSGKDVQTLVQTVRTGVRMIDNAISNSYVPNKKGKKFNDAERPLGLGVMGWTDKIVGDWLIDFESEDYLVANEILMGIISCTATDESANLAREFGPYPNFHKSTWAKGELIVDTSQKIDNYSGERIEIFDKIISRIKALDVPEELKPFAEYYNQIDFEALREKVRGGMRNSTLLAIAPTATIANICNVTSCIELPERTIYEKVNNYGRFNQLPAMFMKVVAAGRPDLIKTAYDVDQNKAVLANCVRQRWVDQSQSFNVFVNSKIKGNELSDIYINGWRNGQKTFYYLRSEAVDTKTRLDAFNNMYLAGKVDTVDSNEEEEIIDDANFCSIDDPSCEACQ